MDWVQQLFTRYPETAVYLALGIGFWVGSFKIGGFSLGGTTGSLLAGLLVGAFFEVPVSASAKSVLFMLFLFAIGYSVGPKFAKSMKGEGWRYAVLGIFVPAVGLLVAWSVASFLDLDPGFAGGLVSGALTESPAIGTASDAIAELGLDPAQTEKLVGHVAVADALCYVFGAFGVIWMCAYLGPKLLRIDVREEAEKLEQQYGIRREQPGVASGWRPFDLRAFRVTEEGRRTWPKASDLESYVPGARIFVVRVERQGRMFDGSPDLELEAGDILALSGPREALVNLVGPGLTEVERRGLLELSVASTDVFLTS